MSPKRHGYGGPKLDMVSMLAWLFAMALVGVLLWMGTTRQRFCCDPKSLVGQLRKV
jgi:hypothetical protein